MKLFILFVTVFCISLQNGFCQKNWSEFSNDLVKIKYPNKWSLTEDPKIGMGIILIIKTAQENDTDEFRENINVLTQDLSGYDLTLDQYVEISEKQLRKIITKGEILISERKVEKDSQEFHQITYTCIQGVFELKIEQWLWIVNDTAYVMTFTSEKNKFDKYYPEAMEIMKSFELKL